MSGSDKPHLPNSDDTEEGAISLLFLDGYDSRQDRLTDTILFLDSEVLNGIVFTAEYALTAVSFNRVPLHELGGLLDFRYGCSRELLEQDIQQGPVVIRRLERFASELPEANRTRRFAERRLPDVKEFYRKLKEYQERVSSR